MSPNAPARRPWRRWLQSTSNRSFVVWPIVLLLLQAALDAGMPRLHLWALPLLAWGYGQYRWMGTQRARQGGGGPGLSKPPERLVITGLYGLTRNPMYLGHLIFFLGLALLLPAGVGWPVFLFHAWWFDRRVRADEASLLARFGAPYAAYLLRVKRWLPGLL